jgi:membrane protein DedA with SNARE-associated domain/rhodanese-related sulfurtransferase
MQFLLTLIEQYGLALVFLNVLALQLGLPIPAIPTLIVVGAAAAVGDRYSVPQVLTVAVVASLIADLVWYAVGAKIGRRALRLMCKLSISPDSCVRQSETTYERWGAPSLMVAKFIPGFAAIATSMAGVVRTRLASFVFFDAIGATLWAGAGVLVGWIFRDAVVDVLAVLEAAGRWGIVALGVALLLWLGVKEIQRQRLLHQLRMARVSVDELQRMLEAGKRPLVVDVRSAKSREQGTIPGSRWVDMQALDTSMRELPVADEVIVFCACPNEASAAAVAKKLMQHGFGRVRPLAGGIDAWVAKGYGVESGPTAQLP